MTCILSALIVVDISAILRMALTLIVCTLMAAWTFDGFKDSNRFKVLLWPSCYLIIVATADSITFSIAEAMVDYPLEELMAFSSARIQFTLIYLLLVAVMVWAFAHLGEPDSAFPLPVSLILFVLMGIGIFAASPFWILLWYWE